MVWADTPFANKDDYPALGAAGSSKRRKSGSALNSVTRTLAEADRRQSLLCRSWEISAG
jgi:hypothetical protein